MLKDCDTFIWRNVANTSEVVHSNWPLTFGRIFFSGFGNYHFVSVYWPELLLKLSVPLQWPYYWGFATVEWIIAVRWLLPLQHSFCLFCCRQCLRSFLMMQDEGRGGGWCLCCFCWALKALPSAAAAADCLSMHLFRWCWTYNTDTTDAVKGTAK